MKHNSQNDPPKFGRAFFSSHAGFSRMGEGELGGKAKGLVFAKGVLDYELAHDRFSNMIIDVPASAILASGVFDAFMERNNLIDLAYSNRPDEEIGSVFQKSAIPEEVLDDLRILVEKVRVPLAVRSSSLMEDTMLHPFAGVYETKMIPNNQASTEVRLERLLEAIKFVYASTYTRIAKHYLQASKKKIEDEKMSVIIQEVVGSDFGDRFYPHISGVARSHNFYPSGRAQRKEGIVNLALGLGKTIVEGGLTWIYSPAYPKVPPPFGSVDDMLKNTQLDFWAVNLREPTIRNPSEETEYLVKSDLQIAESDGALQHLASTFMPTAGRLAIGIGPQGPRILTFAPILELDALPLNDALTSLLSIFKREMGAEVEIEFAVIIREKGPAKMGFLQVRPMFISDEVITIAEDELKSSELIMSSSRVMGNGSVEISDIVYVKPEAFESRLTRQIATELERMNHELLKSNHSYLLIGFGRWGSADPCLGIPVKWSQISGAKAIVEATLPNLNVDPSQGSHFFQNVSSFRISYFHVHHEEKPGIDWSWLDRQPIITETEYIRHVRVEAPLRIKVDGRNGRGGIWSTQR